ncbi:MAG TPA: thioredoxin family protein [Telluria sp.]|jgi:thiol-disulfide isomerase/thioredoxin
MTTILDPWNDADTLAKRLRHADAFLFVLIGAEQWCAKCRQIRPHFDAFMAQAKDSETWLWFDLEEHAEFLGDFLPDDLPTLVVYRGKTLLACEPVPNADDALSLAVARAREIGRVNWSCNPVPLLRDPGIHSRLLTQDWAG